MKCQKCGAEIPENKIYCEKCGAPIQMVPDYSPEEDIRIGEEKKNVHPLETKGVSEQGTKNLGKKKYMIAGILIFLCCVLIYQTAYRMVMVPEQETEAETVVLLEKPVFSLSPGVYTYMPSLTISHPQREEGMIYYTTDGSTPDENSQVFNAPITIGEGKTVVRAVFIRSDGAVSEEADGTYQVEFEYPEEPEFSLEGGSYPGPFSVEITAEPDCTIYYTMDGSEPDRWSDVYTGPIYIPSGFTVLRAVSIDEEGGMSGVMEAIYNVQQNITAGEQNTEASAEEP